MCARSTILSGPVVLDGYLVVLGTRLPLMDEFVTFTDGAVGSAPLLIPSDLFARLQRLAAQVDMDAVELIQIALIKFFANPEVSIDDIIGEPPT